MFSGQQTEKLSIWVSIKHLGNYEQHKMWVPTMRMLLRDKDDQRLNIDPYRCIFLEEQQLTYTYSAWGIDEVRRSPPAQQEQEEYFVNHTGTLITGEPRRIKKWYKVDLPAGFHPVEYYVCGWGWQPFNF